MLNDVHIKWLYFIGDIHAQYKKLLRLLDLLSFDLDNLESNVGNTQLVFMGNLIDNAPGLEGDPLGLLQLVESLVAQNHACCLLGENEFNAIGWATQLRQGEWAITHSASNFMQHQRFLEMLGEGSDQHLYWINWFKKRPLFIDFESVSAIHACWDDPALNAIEPYLNNDNSLKEEHWGNAFDPNHELFALCATLLKGAEYPPKGESLVDITGIIPEWWRAYEQQGHVKPVVVGHYSLSGLPEVQSKNVICVDYNAAKADNPLVSYKVSLSASEPPYEFVNENNFRYVGQPDLEDLTDQGLMSLLDRQKKQFETLQDQNHSEKEVLFIALLSQILCKDWNPLALTDLNACRDAYSDYEEGAFLFAKYADVGLLGGYLYLCQSIGIGLEINNGKQKCARVAWKLINKAKESGIK
ncbi:metallophosphoesterase [Psychromonas ingrahamii 37]|uniref:Metallophosphoesterase n=1 Tax=Psychromonas ingrahamii (strain DSM 17664 / CCUG 51855 / 37) TaxID=357804 RepID=A1SY52_PSYIN|nr:metallophosphoesterase [Psychromonas ingrahamii]ABM04417.1 metallophosphoesterase [Psychromonas ingrahamii 37]